MKTTMSQEEKENAVKHLKNAEKEIQLALYILCGHFVKFYVPLYNFWFRLEKKIQYLEKLETNK